VYETALIIVLLMISVFSIGAPEREGRPGRRAWRVLFAGAVNAITFGTKRAFHGVLRVTRKQLAEMGLTAARFDLLSVLVKCRPGDLCADGVRQSKIRRMLGVTAPVVTRMVRALVGLGLVRRWREHDGDRRQVRVWLTEAGERVRETSQRGCALPPHGYARELPDEPASPVRRQREALLPVGASR
jgi:DNA-binding MarR family transcriptional regulator